MSELKQVRITREMLPGFRRLAKFPKFALANHQGTTWVAHLHEPILLAQHEIRHEFLTLNISRAFDFDPASAMHMDAIDGMAQFVRDEAMAGHKIEHDVAPEHFPAPEFLALAHGGWIVENEEDRWLGIIRTRSPRFISEMSGESILPLDPCEDLGPFLQSARAFCQEFTKRQSDI